LNAPHDIHVVAVIPGPEQGNSMNFCKRQVESLKEAGVSIMPFYLSSRTSLPVLLRERKRFRKMCSEFEPSVIHSQYGTVTALFCLLSSNASLLITFQGSDINGANDVGRARRYLGILFSQLSALKAKRIICVSEPMKRKLWWNRERAVVLPMGVDLNFYAPMSREAARKQLGWPNGEKTVLFNASRPIVKRLDIAREVEKEIAKSAQNVTFCFLDGDVSRERMRLYLCAADVLLVCSDSEGSPVLVKEAMACNLPIVSSDAGDIASRIKNVSQCSIVAREPELMAEEILSILAAGSRSDGRWKIVEDRLSEADISLKVKEIYFGICAHA
jgi:teichuronic acid biosynthesis glycosyltransferase TuaC